MKKFNIFLMMALAIGFTSCEDEWVEALPQTSEQGSVFTGNNFVMNNEMPESLVLTEAEAEKAITVAKFVSADSFPADGTVEFAMQIAKSEDFAEIVEVPVTNNDGVATATYADLQEAYAQLHGKNPNAHDVYVRFAACVVTPNVKAQVRVDGLETYFGNKVVSVTPYDPGYRMEEAYYLVWSTDAESISLSNAERVLKFEHSDKDVYDDTNFSLVVDVPSEASGSFCWVVLPQSLYEAGTLEGAYGAEEGFEYELNGPMYPSTSQDYTSVAICSEILAGQYQFAVNMYSKDETVPSYTVSPAFKYLYTPGNSNGWNHGAANMLGTNDYVNYWGYAYLNGEFKFTNAPDWAHTNYGNAGTDGQLTTDGSADNLMAANAGVYWCTVDIRNLTYTITEITTMGLIGGFNSWGESLPMTAQVDGTASIKYVGEVTLKAGEEFKFRANDGWDINLGGTFEELTPGGNNLSVSEDGTYSVVLDLTTLPYNCTLTKK